MVNKLIMPIVLAFLLIGVASAFSIQKQLVQLSVDENYPCHIENTDTIVCPALDSGKIASWKDAITNLKDDEKDKGILKDSDKIKKLDDGKTLYSGKVSKEIDITKEYREKVDVYSLGDTQISIGFATNLFGVSGTPLENFDVNSTLGIVTYRPLNMTWIQFTGAAGSPAFSAVSSMYDFDNTADRNTVSFWLNLTDSGNTVLISTASGANDGWELDTNSSSTLLMFKFVNGAGNPQINTSITKLSDGAWHNLIVRDNGTWINVTLDKTQVLYNSSWTNIPYTGKVYSADFASAYDEVRVYNISINDVEVNNIYNLGRILNYSLNSTGLISIWSFNEMNGTSTIYDRSGNNINATLNYLPKTVFGSDNINVTTLGYQVNITIVNITNALIFYDNNSLINYSFTGNKTFSFFNNQTVYILENFNVTYGVSRTYSPLSISLPSSNDYHIINLLDKNVDSNVIIPGLSCTNIANITYKADDGTTTSIPTTSCPSFLTGYSLTIQPATSSNELVFGYSIPAATSVCNSIFGGYTTFFSYFPIMVVILAIVVIIGIIIMIIYATKGEGVEWDKKKMITAIAIGAGFFLLAILAVVFIIVLNSLCGI